jgi:phosphatidylserine decarboxylase
MQSLYTYLNALLRVFSLSLAFEMGCFPIADVSRLEEGTGRNQVAAGSDLGLTCLLFWPRHYAAGITDPPVQPYIQTLSLCAPSALSVHRLEGPKKKNSFFCLNFYLSPTNAHIFKIGISIFQVIALTKRQKNLLGFCYGFKKARPH